MMNVLRNKAVARGAAAMLAGLLAVSCLGGCARKQEPAMETTESTAWTEEATTAPALPVVTGNNNAASLLCKGSYTEDGQDQTVVARAGESELTNRMLRIFYNMEIAAFRQEEQPEQPDYEEPLDTQKCGLTGENISWQHYFLDRALKRWYNCQVLWNRSKQPQEITEKNYKAEPTTHEQFFSKDLPAYPYLYGYKEEFMPNTMHQAYLDQLPDMLDALAVENGFSGGEQMAKALAGSGASKEDLNAYAQLYNRAYMYFTELSYSIKPTDEELDAYIKENAGKYTDEEKVVGIRHCLLIPEKAQVAADGTVTASEDAWKECVEKGQKLLEDRKKSWLSNRSPEGTFATLANQNSCDEGTRLDGGRYVNIRKGTLNAQIEEWAFADDRQPQDVELLQTDMGVELLYWIGGSTQGREQARQDLMQRLYEAAVAELKTDNPFSVDYSAVCLTGSPSPAAPDSLLYSDVAHEHYPEIPLYLQQDYAPAPFGAYKVSRHGCGITTFAMVSSYLADETLTPAYLAARYYTYAVPNGTNGDIFDQIPPELGYFCEGRTWSWIDVENALRDDRIAVSLQVKGYFTKTGHYLALQEMTENGNVVVRDSNIYNYTRLKEHKVDNFEVSDITTNNSVYWIFQPKITRIPVCSRCGDPENAQMPDILLRQEYVCHKCQNALVRRNGFMALLGE